MKYIHKTTSEIKQHYQLKLLYPNSSVAKDGTEVIGDYHVINEVDKPEYDKTIEKIVESAPELTDGKYYQVWSVVLLNSGELMNVAKAEIASIKIAIDELIQSEIDEYNELTGVAFDNIDALPKYELRPLYTHHEFCVSMLDWNFAVWEEARLLQINIATGIIAKPDTVEEFLALLPTRV